MTARDFCYWLPRYVRTERRREMEPLLRQDGVYTLYRVEVQWGDGRWGAISDTLIARVPLELCSEDIHTNNYTGRQLEPFQSFSSSGECWQKIGIHGTFDK
jgi:hypothetical protein